MLKPSEGLGSEGNFVLELGLFSELGLFNWLGDGNKGSDDLLDELLRALRGVKLIAGSGVLGVKELLTSGNPGESYCTSLGWRFGLPKEVLLSLSKVLKNDPGTPGRTGSSATCPGDPDCLTTLRGAILDPIVEGEAPKSCSLWLSLSCLCDDSDGLNAPKLLLPIKERGLSALAAVDPEASFGEYSERLCKKFAASVGGEKVGGKEDRSVGLVPTLELITWLLHSARDGLAFVVLMA